MKKNIVLIGGGHGLSNLVRGFKNEDIDLTVIVSSTDDGGHTGKIRDEFNCVAVGDLRMVLSELVEKDSMLKYLFDYRFSSIHGTKNVSLGNLVITALLDKYKDIDLAINYLKEKANIKANLFLSTNNPLVLCAECDNKEIIMHERIIGESNKKIERLFVDGKAVCNAKMLEKIKKSDVIILSPGSLYTSVGSVLCIEEIKETIKNSDGEIIYVCNMMTQDGETKDFSVKDHVTALEKLLNKSIDRVIVNKEEISKDVLEKYKEENSYPLICDEISDNYEFYDLVEIIDDKVRHDSELVKKIILNQ